MLKNEIILKNWEVFLKKTELIGNITNKANDILTNKTLPLVTLRENFPNNKKFCIINIPSSVLSIFLDYFNIDKDLQLNLKELNSLKVGKIIEVKERTSTNREALLVFPLEFFTNGTTFFKQYTKDFSEEQMTEMCYAYLQVDVNNPLFNYIDRNNHFITKFILDDNGSILTNVGKSNTAYQYFQILHNEMNVSNYQENYLSVPYRKKVRDINSNYIDAPKNATSVLYKNINIAQSFNSQNVLMECDLITEQSFKDIPKKELMQLSKQAESVELTKKLMLRLISLKDDDYTTMSSGINIYKDKVTYLDQELKSSIITPYTFLFDTKSFFPPFATSGIYKSEYVYHNMGEMYHNMEELNWENYLDSFIKYHWLKISCLSKPEIDLKIGNVDIKLEYKYNSNTFYINGKRINKDEVVPVLYKALCYTDTKQYNSIVEIISKTSLEIHKFIAEGLTFDLNISSFTKELKTYIQGSDNLDNLKSYFKVTFRIVRIKNSNFIEMKDGTMIKIKNTRALLNLKGKTVQYGKFKEVFGPDNNIFDGEVKVDEDVNIGEIISQAKERYIKAFEKSKKLLADAIEEVGAEVVKNWNSKKGVKVDGISGNTYFIEISNMDNPLEGEVSCRVYHYTTGNYICIVDKHGGGHQAGVDRAVARLYALRNDSLLANDVYTLHSYLTKDK